MRLKKLVWVNGLVLISLALASCNIGKAPEPTPDVNAIYTSAAQTMIAGLNAQQTQTAAAVPPTAAASPTPLASVTPLATFAIGTGSVPFGTPFALGTPFTFGTPGLGLPTAGATAGSLASGCDNSAWVQDQGVQDGDVLKPGQDFDRVFVVQNTGTCTWDDGYTLVYLGGTLDGYDIKITRKEDFVAPGEMGDFGLHLTASNTPNTYTECWRLKNDHGFFFGTNLCVTIKVQK